ncbi:hypothetical protein ZIOFF_039558 [Zingiber officinale]|uniref:Pectinesterase n=1 Tax=Zingiber officinale TaxID=94328 RepID=A0A8J5L383_ZINOF|nr:hypothetical protein ZIOFF_039558 [Zingiber officinale]
MHGEFLVASAAAFTLVAAAAPDTVADLERIPWSPPPDHAREDRPRPPAGRGRYDEPWRGAWTDGVKLLADTVGHVNQPPVHPGDDAQTWLNAAMANQRTCCGGFLELGLMAPPLAASDVKSDLVVAKDGSGDYKTIVEAVAASAKVRGGSTSRFVIHVKADVYQETVEIPNSMENLMMTGDRVDATVVTGNKSFKDDYTTFRSTTFG